MIKKFDSYINENYNINENKVVSFDDDYNNFVIMVGSPGAGKSFVSKNLINLKDFKYINVDKERRIVAKKLGYDISDPEQNLKLLDVTHTTSDPRNRTINHLKLLLKNQNGKQKPNILFDAGGGQIEVMTEIHKLAKEAGYKTTMVIVKTSLPIALKRNNERERKLTDDMVIDYYNKVEKSYNILFDMFDESWIVYNDDIYDFKNRPTNRIIKIK